MINKLKTGLTAVAILSCIIIGLFSFKSPTENKKVLIVRTYEGKGWLKDQGIYLFYGDGRIEKKDVSSDYLESANDVVNVLNKLYTDGWTLKLARDVDGGNYNGPSSEYILEK